MLTSGEVWTQNRLKIRDGLSQLYNPIPAQLYTRIFDLLENYSPSSTTGRVDLALIGHCVRELMNGLPDYLGDEGAVGNNKAAEQNAIEKLRQLLLETCDNESFVVTTTAEFVPIPSRIAAALGQFRDASRIGSDSNKKKASLAVIGSIDGGNPALIPWLDVQNYFYKYVHMNRGEAIELPDRETVNKKLSYLDNSLTSRLGYFFDAKHQLVDVLSSANAKAPDGSFGTPTDEMIGSALSLIANPGLRFVFFSELNNPEWLSLLKQQGVFTNMIEAGAQIQQCVTWPEKFYLEKMVTVYPELVSEIINEASDVHDSFVRHAIIDIANSLPVENALDTMRKVILWANQECIQDTYFWIDDKITQLIVRFLASDIEEARKLGKKLFQSCFMPRRDDSGVFSEITALVPKYFYSRKFRELSNSFHLIPLSARRGMLYSFIINIMPNPESNRLSSLLFPSIEREIDNRTESISGEVIFQFVHVVLESLEDSPAKTVAWLQKKKESPLAVRCAFVSMRKLLEESSDDACNIDSQIISYIHRELLSGYIVELEYDPEFYPLLSSSIKRGIISSEEADNLLCDAYKTKYQIYQSRYEELGNYDSGEAARAANRWIHRAMSLIGLDLLGDSSRCLFDKLNLEIPHSNYSATHVSETETKWGPISPINCAQMIEMGPDDLLEYLRVWHPTREDAFNLISHRGQGRELEKVVAQDPFFFDGCYGTIGLLRPIYLQAILDGWGRVLRDGTMDVPISGVLAVIEAAVQIPESKTWEVEGDGFDDDANYFGVHRAAARLAGYLLEGPATVLSEAHGNQLLEVLIKLANSSEPDVEYEKRYGGDNEDPLTLAMNTIRPIALLGIVKWVENNVGNTNISRALDELEKHLPHRSPFLSEAAAFGEALPRLYGTAPKWVNENYNNLFGERKANVCQQVVLTTALTLFMPTITLYELLSAAMLKALDNHAESYEVGLRALNRDCLSQIGHWAYILFATGSVHHDDLVLSRWRGNADGEHLGLVLGMVCGALDSDNKDIDDGIAVRVGELWDYHRDTLVNKAGGGALSGVVHLIRSGLYDVSWWGPRLLAELEVNLEKVSIFVAKDFLLPLSEFDSELAIKVLQMIAERDHYPLARHYREIGLELLRRSKQLNHGVLSITASKCMDYLGSIGCLDLDKALID